MAVFSFSLKSIPNIHFTSAVLSLSLSLATSASPSLILFIFRRKDALETVPSKDERGRREMELGRGQNGQIAKWLPFLFPRLNMKNNKNRSPEGTRFPIPDIIPAPFPSSTMVDRKMQQERHVQWVRFPSKIPPIRQKLQGRPWILSRHNCDSDLT